MKVPTTRFGEVEIDEKQVYCFPEGLLGFAPIKLYFVLNNPKGGPFQWLQAVNPPELAFVVCAPRLFMPDYKVFVRKEDLQNIELENVDEGLVLVILTVPPNPQDITANLMGPLVFNPKKMLAKQLVLADPQYSTKHRVFPDVPADSKKE
jgi:flagellar assembly factor FliW